MTKISNLYSLTNYINADSSGDIGIGIVPQWNWSTYLALEISTTGVIYAGNGQMAIGNNAYYSTSWKYKTSAAATLLTTDSGAFQFSNAASGTAGNTISWIDRFRITSSGLVGIGTTSPGAQLEVRCGTGANLRVRENGTNNLLLQNYNTADAYRNMQFAASTLQFLTGTEAGTDASERMRITATGNVGIGTTGSPWTLFTALDIGANATLANYTDYAFLGSNVYYSSSGDWRFKNTGYGTGLYMRKDDGNLFFATFGTGSAGAIATGTERMRITSAGNVLIGTTAEDGKALNVSKPASGWQAAFINQASSLAQCFFSHGEGYGAYIDSGSLGNSNLRYIFKAVSGGSERFIIRGDGLMVNPPLVSTFTTSSGANLYADPSNGAISRSTSSIKYKKNVEDYTKGLDIVMQLRPVSYEGKSEMDAGKTFAGLIAEEVHDLGLPEFVQYAADGSPDALAYQNMVALLIKAIQELSAKVTALENK